MSNSLRMLTNIIFLYTCVEGLVINMLYPMTLPFIFKDFAIILLYFVMLTENRSSAGSLSKLSAPVALFGITMFFFLLMPSPVGLFSEAVALKQRLLYIPLMYAGYHYVRDDEDLKGLMRLMAWSAIPVGLFGIYLYFAGPSGLKSMGANYSAVFFSTAGAAGIAFYRVPGTFNSPGQFGMYLLANALLFTGVLFMPTVAPRQRLLTIVSLVITIGALLVSGSRAPLLVLFMCSAIILVLMGKVSGLGSWAVGLYSVLTLGFSMFGDGVKDRVGSIASWENVERFQSTWFGQLFLSYVIDAPLGKGLGIATIGARHFAEGNIVWLVESYYAILAAETGVFGVLALAYLDVAIILFVLRRRSGMEYAPGRSVWYASSILVLFIALFMPINTALDSAPANLYFWFFLGVSARLYDLERWRIWRLTTQAVTSRPVAGVAGQTA
jgi:hypothetical protein